MSARQKAWARMARLRLIQQLGGKCKKCGWTSGLEIDCIRPAGDRHHKMDTSARMSFYHAQHRAKNVQVLCATCHIEKTAHDTRHQRKKALAEFYSDQTVRESPGRQHDSHVKGHDDAFTTDWKGSEEPY